MPNEYRERAAECWRLAREATNPTNRTSLIEMAEAWLRLADQAARNLQTDLVYETPTRSTTNQQPGQQQQQQQQSPPAQNDEND